jgi:hypothetical protein
MYGATAYSSPVSDNRNDTLIELEEIKTESSKKTESIATVITDLTVRLEIAKTTKRFRTYKTLNDNICISASLSLIAGAAIAYAIFMLTIIPDIPQNMVRHIPRMIYVSGMGCIGSIMLLLFTMIVTSGSATTVRNLEAEISNRHLDKAYCHFIDCINDFYKTPTEDKILEIFTKFGSINITRFALPYTILYDDISIQDHVDFLRLSLLKQLHSPLQKTKTLNPIFSNTAELFTLEICQLTEASVALFASLKLPSPTERAIGLFLDNYKYMQSFASFEQLQQSNIPIFNLKTDF